MATLRNLPQRLDSFSKILIATGQINYMASSIDGVNEQIKISGLGEKDVHKEGLQQRERVLSEVVRDLSKVMNKLGDIINSHDCICAIDMRIAKIPFEIIVSGMDEVDNDYEIEEAAQ